MKPAYKIWKYNGGEIGVRVENPEAFDTVFRIQSSDDLIAMFMAINAYEYDTDNDITSITIPYLPYARQDRIATHGDGWYDLIRNLCDYITAVTRRKMWVKLKEGVTVTNKDREWKSTDVDCPIIRFTQVKEKFAGLRIYFDAYHEVPDDLLSILDPDDLEKQKNRIWTIVSEAIEFTEYLSCRTCEICGKKGKVYRDGWWKTLCDEHKGDRMEISEDELP